MLNWQNFENLYLGEWTSEAQTEHIFEIIVWKSIRNCKNLKIDFLKLTTRSSHSGSSLEKTALNIQRWQSRSARRNEAENWLSRFRSEDHHDRLILILWNESVFFWNRLEPSCLHSIILSVQNLFNTKEFFVGKRPCARIRLERAAIDSWPGRIRRCIRKRGGRFEKWPYFSMPSVMSV